jgi:hypothetical protein
LRHGLASWLVNQGTDVKTVQGLLRHANVYDAPRALRAPGEFLDDGGTGLRHAGHSVRDANGAIW